MVCRFPSILAETFTDILIVVAMYIELLLPRMFGYSSGQPTTKSHFGSVPSLFAMDDVSCFGNETSLLNCPHATVDNCGSHEAAGVICSNSGPMEAI